MHFEATTKQRVIRYIPIEMTYIPNIIELYECSTVIVDAESSVLNDTYLRLVPKGETEAIMLRIGDYIVIDRDLEMEHTVFDAGLFDRLFKKG